MSVPIVWIVAGVRITGDVVVVIAKLFLAMPRPLNVIALGSGIVMPRLAGSGLTVALEMRTVIKKFLLSAGEMFSLRFEKVARPLIKVVVDTSRSDGAQPKQFSGCRTPSALVS